MCALAHLREPTEFLDHGAPALRRFAAGAVRDSSAAPRAIAVELYYAVRDEIRYEVYGADLSRRGLTASAVAERGRGMCIHKSVLFAAAARLFGIPSRLTLVDVRNHVASARLQRLLGGDVVSHHCYAQLWLDGSWVKATPVFSATLCRLYRMPPLEFDGRTDSLLQAHDDAGRSRLEITHEHGTFDDVPYERLIAGLRAAHPRLLSGSTRVRAGSLMLEAPGRTGLDAA